MIKKTKPKKVIEDLSVEIQQNMQMNHRAYESYSKDLFHYIEDTLTLTLLEFKSEKRMDKIQFLHLILLTFLDKLVVEKNALNLQLLNAELKLDPNLAAKLEKVVGPGKIINGQIDVNSKSPENPNQGGVRFSK